MARLARVVVPGVPHHVTQRGNRRQDVFFDPADRRRYLELLDRYSRSYGLSIWAYCLMTNHVHLVAVPADAHALGRTMRDTHTTYAAYANRRLGEMGHLWQGRFFSTPLDEQHLWRALRYVECNCLRAGLVPRAEDYPWSSAAAHCGLRADRVLSGELELADRVGDWSSWLHEPADQDVELLRNRTRTGRPCGSDEFIARLEALLGRVLATQKAGRKRKSATADGKTGRKIRK